MANYSYERLEHLTTGWASDRGILINGKVITQAMKLGEEFGELCSHIAKGQDIKDDIGDMIVVLNNIAQMSGTSLKECWNEAYDDIKDRKGYLTEEGVFIKETDPNYSAYAETIKEHNVITKITVSSVPKLFPEYVIQVMLSNDTIEGFTFIPTHLTDLDKFPDFKGKTVGQLKDYLINTIGGEIV